MAADGGVPLVHVVVVLEEENFELVLLVVPPAEEPAGRPLQIPQLSVRRSVQALYALERSSM